jgi:outer membrane receptor protein involved in Fe transport
MNRLRRSIFFTFLMAVNSLVLVADEDEQDVIDDESIDRISVVASRNLTGSETDATQNVAYVSAESLNTVPQKASDLLSSVPGVSYNGQGGLWQAYSVRGVSRWRVQSLINGIPIQTERRAGNALSFIDPILIDSISVLKGPASTYYGSGALGGVVNVMPQQIDGRQLVIDYVSEGNQHAVAYLFGNESYSGGIAHRSASQGKDASENRLNDSFSQTSMVLNAHQDLENGLQMQYFFAPSIGKNIGKPNLEHPSDKVTVYPFEKHLIGSVSLVSSGDYALKWFFHDQSWQSDVLRVNKRRNIVDYQATDWGINFQKNWSTELFSGRWGIDSLRRQNVDVSEEQLDLDNQLIWSKLNLSGQHQEFAIYADSHYQWDTQLIQAGLRWNHYQQKSNNADDTQQSRITGFIGYKAELNPNWQLFAHIGSGFRFAALTEKYFSGTTGRGTVVGNPDLLAETALNYEVGLRYDQPSWSALIQWFNMDVKNYIERVEVGEGDDAYLTYRNVKNGQISGIEGHLNWMLSEDFEMAFKWQLQKGEDKTGAALADISPQEVSVDFTYMYDDWQFGADYTHRKSKTKFASGEVPLQSANLIDISGSYQGFDDWIMKLYMTNLTDENYFASADDLSNQAYGRQVGIQISRSF